MSERRQRFLRAKAIVVEADEMPVQLRAAFIEGACHGDAELQHEVCWLQAALETQTRTSSPSSSHAGPDDLCGAEIGPAGAGTYRLLHQLGRGGMGVVYLAERRFGDASVQKVALKLLDVDGWPAGAAEQRFSREAAILARLSHPHIAGLLDSGRLADGRPYLAMEYVQGERIDRWCAAHARSLRDRVKLFLKVCAAVQHAHRHLVIHRDIKPANILVDAQGEPKLLDFGIARLLDEEGIGVRTESGVRALTLAYASPEQVRNQALSTASDVWQLGVVLYELVSGTRPFPQSESPLTLSHAILTGEVSPPSLATAGSTGQGACPGTFPRMKVPADIDAIVLKAMRPMPAERYASVEELAQDLCRFLDSRPVLAHRGQWWYRTRRFMQRHRGGVAAGTLIVALLAGFAVEREVQLRHTAIERDKAQALAGFMRGVFEDADPARTRGNRITMVEALDLGVERLRDRSDLGAQVRASLLLSIGRGYTALDLGDRAIPVLREAEALTQQHGIPAIERARVLAALGRAYSMVFDTPTSITMGQEAIALFESVAGDHAGEILRVRINVLFGHLTVGDLPRTEMIRSMDDIIAALVAGDASDPELLAQALAARSMMRLGGGDDAGAAADAEQALHLANGLYRGQDPALIYYRFTAAIARIRSDPPRAVREFRDQVADYEAMSAEPTPGLGALLAHFGWALAAIGHHEDAVRALRRAETIARRHAGAAPDFHLRTLTGLAEQLQVLGRNDDAVALIKPALPAFSMRSPHGSAWAVNAHLGALNVLGAASRAQGDLEMAKSRYREALALADQHPLTARGVLRTASLDGLCSMETGERACRP